MTDTDAEAELTNPRPNQKSQFRLRPIQMWIVDTQSAGFAEECARQSKLIAGAENGRDCADELLWFGASDKTGWEN